jgi:hypothetical protein
MDVDCPTHVDTDTRGIHTDRSRINTGRSRIDADRRRIHDRRSHIIGLVDVGTPGVASPPARLGSLRPD